MVASLYPEYLNQHIIECAKGASTWSFRDLNVIIKIVSSQIYITKQEKFTGK